MNRGSLAFILIALAACTTGEAETPTAIRTDSSGVTIAMNPGDDRPLNWTFTERFRIGGEESGPASFYSVNKSSVGTDTSGNIYVLDPASHRVVVFDSIGAFVRDMGAEGGGPGEMRMPAQLSVRASGDVAVYDYSREGLVAFDARGKTIDLPPIGEPGAGPPAQFRAAGAGWVVERMNWNDTGAVRIHTVARRVPGTIVPLARVQSTKPKMVMYESCRVGISMGPMFEATFVWDANDSIVAVNAEPGYVIDLYSHDSVGTSIRRDVPLRATTGEMAAQEIGDGLKLGTLGGRRECTLDPAETIEKRGMAASLPAIEWLRIAPDGRLWVQRKTLKGDDPVVDLFDGGGDYLGTLPAGAPVPVAFLPNGDVVSIHEDEDTEIDRVVVYSVVTTAPASHPQ